MRYPSASVYYEVSTDGKLPAPDIDDIKALTQRHINEDATKDNVFGEARWRGREAENPRWGFGFTSKFLSLPLIG